MIDSKKTKLEYREGRPSVLRKPTVWRELNFYKRSEILYQLTVAFCRRFLPKYGDTTVDQMVQAARSTKQNIIDFQLFFGRWNDSEMANCAICLAHMIDKALTTTLANKDKEFVTQGGIRERMTAARLGYRTDQREHIASLERENATLKAEVARLKAALAGRSGETGGSGMSGKSGESGITGKTGKTGISGVNDKGD